MMTRVIAAIFQLAFVASTGLALDTDATNTTTFSVQGDQILLDGEPFKIIGLRCSNALISDEATDDLIATLPVYCESGINTVSVFFMGSRFGDVKGYLPDASLDPVYADRMARIIMAADEQKMLVVVGCLYWSTSKAKEELGHWKQEDANRAIANTVRWLSDHDYRNVFVDVDNEGMAHDATGWSIAELIDAGHAVDPTIMLAYNDSDPPPDNADLYIHHSPKVKGKPWLDTEATPGKSTPGGYWGSFSKETHKQTNGSYYNYSRIGRYTEAMKAEQIRRTVDEIDRFNGHMLASTWLQCATNEGVRGPFTKPGGHSRIKDIDEDIDRLHADAGIAWWLEFVKDRYGPWSPEKDQLSSGRGDESSASGLVASSTTFRHLRDLRFHTISKFDGFPEGPSYRASDDSYFFSGNNALTRVDSDGQLHVILSKPGGGGTHFLPDGSVLIVGHVGLRRLFPDGRVALLADGKQIGAGNDLSIGIHGEIYFSVPKSGIYRLTAGKTGRLVKVADQGCNGLEVDPEGRYLYVVRSSVQRYPIDITASKLGAPETVLEFPKGKGGGDGCAFDSLGNLYSMHFRTGVIRVVDPGKKRLIAEIPVGVIPASNLTFGGPDNSDLFVTAGAPKNNNCQVLKTKLGIAGFRGHPGSVDYPQIRYLEYRGDVDAFAVRNNTYTRFVRSHLDRLIRHGTDTYGPETTNMWLATIDTSTGRMPEVALPNQLRWYRKITSPRGSNLYWDGPSLLAAYEISKQTGDTSFAEKADAYIDDFVDRCVASPSGLFLWGNHVYYDVATDKIVTFSGGYHECRPHTPPWELLWDRNPKVTEQAVRAMGLAHIKDHGSGRFCRHANWRVAPGTFTPDEVSGAKPFLEAGAVLIDSLCWLAAQKGQRRGELAEMALQVARYSYDQRESATGLLRNQPVDRRWDYYASTTEVGLWAGSLLRAANYTGNSEFSEIAQSVIRPWVQIGFDDRTGKYYGRLDVATGRPQPPENPRGWIPPMHAEVFDMGERPTHNYPMPMAEACLSLYQSSQDPVYELATQRWVTHIRNSLPAGEGRGAYAEDYGRAIHFLVRASQVFDRPDYKQLARKIADEAISHLYIENEGMFRSHPGEDRCDAVDGPGILLLALLFFDTGQERNSAFAF